MVISSAVVCGAVYSLLIAKILSNTVCVYSPMGFADVHHSGHTEHGVSDAGEYCGLC